MDNTLYTLSITNELTLTEGKDMYTKLFSRGAIPHRFRSYPVENPKAIQEQANAGQI